MKNSILLSGVCCAGVLLGSLETKAAIGLPDSESCNSSTCLQITNTSTTGNAIGVYGKGVSGVYGEGSEYGVFGSSDANTGVLGYSSGSGWGVNGASTSGIGVVASSSTGVGVSVTSSSSNAIVASSTFTDSIVSTAGSGSGSAGIWGKSNGSNGYSLYGSGDMRIVALGTQTGVATKPGGGSWTAPSDARIKKDVVDFTLGLAELAKVHPVRFKYNGLGGTTDNGKEYVGVIAQELEKVMPSMVSSSKAKLRDTDKSSIDLKVVDPSAFTYTLVNAVNELSARNKELERRVERLALLPEIRSSRSCEVAARAA